MTQRSITEPTTSPIASTVDLIGVLWRRRIAWLSCLAFTVLCGAVLYLVTPTTYESETAVLLVEKNPQAVTRDSRFESGFEAFLATHRALIVSPLIVERAIKAENLQSLSMFADLPPTEDLVEYIIENLEAGNAGRELGENADSIMTLSFRGTEAEECPIVVSAIVNSYKGFLDEAYRGMSDDVLRLVAQAQSLLENKLQRQEDAYIEFRRNSPLVTQGPEEVNPLQERLAAIDAQRSELMLLQTSLRAQLAAVEKAQREGVEPSQLVALISDVRRQLVRDESFVTTANGLDAQLIQLTDREQQLLELLGPNHPHVTTIRKRIEAARKLQALPTTAHFSDVGSAQGLSDARVGELYVHHLRQLLDQVDTSQRLLTELYEREHATAKALAAYQLRDERFQRDITRTEQLYDEVISKLQEASLVKGIGGYEARVIAQPLVGKKAGPSLIIYGGGSVVLGLMLGLGAALTWEVVDGVRQRSVVSESPGENDIE